MAITHGKKEHVHIHHSNLMSSKNSIFDHGINQYNKLSDYVQTAPSLRIWEETADSVTSYLLKTVLSKSEKDYLKVSQAAFQDLKDINALKRQFTQVFERLARGKLQSGSGDTSMEITEEKQLDEIEEMPQLGSQISEKHTRLLSARTRSVNHTLTAL
ncbi:unnamed protein product [Callosobruchus maculatus]|uniref:PTHB1 C-terminal helix bundle domain-containing protein n=1 Tax=Callosobruchus maculatus TaxID=64391 RepID=A0A653BZ19_CALMS|nr:unnamed protein product [Callosobruchus maculatus]